MAADSSVAGLTGCEGPSHAFAPRLAPGQMAALPRWLAPASAVGFAAAVILLPWVSGGGYDLPFWDTRTAVFEEGLWDLITQNLGVGLLGLCVAAVVASAYDDTVKDNERTLQAVELQAVDTDPTTLG